MSRDEKAPSLKLTSQFMKCERDVHFRPDERKASAEALICLNCPLPDCNRVKCPRFEEAAKKIRRRSRRIR